MIRSKEDLEKEHFTPIKLYGREVLFTDLRIDSKLIPTGLHKYEIRHDDECLGEMVELSKRILVNHWGTILSDKPIDLGLEGYREINEDRDVKDTDKPVITLKQYMNKIKNRDQEVR